MKKIVFCSITPPHSAYPLQSFRVLYSYLRHTGTADLFEFDQALFITDQPGDRIAADLLARKADMVCFSVHTWSYYPALAAAAAIKNQSPDTLIVWGGTQATHLADELMTKGVDIVVRGDGENPFDQLLRRWADGRDDWSDIPGLTYRQGDQVIRTPDGAAFEVDKQTYELFIEDNHGFRILYETSRGCPFKCRYCCWSSAGRALKFYPRSKIRADLEKIFALPRVGDMALTDSNFFLNKNHGLWVLDQIVELNRIRRDKGWQPIRVGFEVNPQFMDKDIVAALLSNIKDLGEISCGLQTIGQEVNRDHLDRAYDREEYFTRLRYLWDQVESVREHRTFPNHFFIETIYGLPGDTIEGFKETLNHLIANYKGLAVLAFRFQVLPGSYFWDHAADYDLVYEAKGPHCLISSNTFTTADLDQAQRLTRFTYLFLRVLKPVGALLYRLKPADPLAALEQVADHLVGLFPEFTSHLNQALIEDDEVEFSITLNNYLVENRTMRRRIIEAANAELTRIAGQAA